MCLTQKEEYSLVMVGTPVSKRGYNYVPRLGKAQVFIKYVLYEKYKDAN